MQKYNRDGGIWRVRWKQSDGRFSGHVIGHADIKFEASSWPELADAATDAIDTRLQAGEYTIDWTPQPPLEGKGWRVHPGFVSLFGNDGVYLPANDFDEIYTSGRCPRCHCVGYPRTDATMRVEIESAASICQGRNLWSERASPNYTPILTEAFAASIEEACPGMTQWRPTERIGRGRIKFVEPFPANPIPAVGVTTRETGGWRCECGTRHFGQNDFEYTVGECIPASAVPVDTSAFWIHHSIGKLELCVSTDLWEHILETKAVRGVTTGVVPVVEDQYIDHNIESRLRVGV